MPSQREEYILFNIKIVTIYLFQTKPIPSVAAHTHKALIRG